jgi:glycosyltransferase involved in cell wall biosynthesis
MTLRVAIDARVIPGTGGGVETLAIGLAEGFASLRPKDVSVVFLTYAGHTDWIRQIAGGAFQVAEVDPPSRFQQAARRSKLWDIRPASGSFSALPEKEKHFERLDVDLVHFILQGGSRTKKPFIYHPHDLQHRHLPEHFTARQRAFREVKYGYMCRTAAAIAVGSTWVKEDLMSQMNVPEYKIHVVPLAPLNATDGREAIRAKLSQRLPSRYVVYPAASWAHKNHAALFEAIALLRTSGLEIPVILTGSRSPGMDLETLAIKSGVGDLIRDLGYLSQAEARHVLAKAQALVLPTLFEAASFPIWEAFSFGVPVACSDVTSLPRQVGDAAIVFDPRNPNQIADSLSRLWSSEESRDTLSSKGAMRVAQFNWERTVTHFVALYKHALGLQMSQGEMAHLEGSPIL